MFTIELLIVLVASVLIGMLAGFLLVVLIKKPITISLGGAERDVSGDDSTSDDMLRIFQRGVGYPLLIEIGGRRYRKIDDIEDGREQALVMAALRKLVAQVSPDELAAPAEQSPPAVEEAPQPDHRVSPPAAAGVSSPASLSLIDEIDDILQSILADDPDAPAVVLRQAPDGGMRINVEGRIYDDVDDVQDPKVREALQAAVERWEARTS